MFSIRSGKRDTTSELIYSPQLNLPTIPPDSYHVSLVGGHSTFRSVSHRFGRSRDTIPC